MLSINASFEKALNYLPRFLINNNRGQNIGEIDGWKLLADKEFMKVKITSQPDLLRIA